MAANPDPSSYTWGLALIALALAAALLGALADRVQAPVGRALQATAVADPMGFSMPRHERDEHDGPSMRLPRPASVASIPTD